MDNDFGLKYNRLGNLPIIQIGMSDFNDNQFEQNDENQEPEKLVVNDDFVLLETVQKYPELYMKDHPKYFCNLQTLAPNRKASRVRR
jgi:hypothetical protein